MESIAGASKGNFTMMDNLGVAMNATTIEAYAMSKGINKSYNEMTKAEQVEMAMQMFLEKTSYAMGNYAKENETFAGSLQTMKASISNLMAGTGDLDQVIESVSNFGNIVVKSIGEMAPKIVNGIVGLINGLVPMLPTLLQNLLPSVINGVIMLVQGIVNSLPTILTTLASMLPTIITSVLDGLIQVMNALTEMLPVLIPQIVDAILGLIPILIDNLPLFVKAGWQLITGLTTGIIRSVPTLLSHIPKLVKSIFGYFKQMPKMALDIGKDLVKGLWNGIKDVSGWVLDKIKGFGKSILKGIKGIFGIKSPSKEFEYIGKMNILGFEKPFDEQKDELQSKFESLFDLSPSLYGTSSLNLSPNVNVYVENNMKEDRLGQLVNSVKTFSGGAKNDYSYGMGA
jgi:phage-related protein